jgi:riboflavin transporter FmnP
MKNKIYKNKKKVGVYVAFIIGVLFLLLALYIYDLIFRSIFSNSGADVDYGFVIFLMFLLFLFIILPGYTLMSFTPLSIEIKKDKIKIKTVYGYRWIDKKKLKRIFKGYSKLTEITQCLYFSFSYGILYLTSYNYTDFNELIKKLNN